MNHSGDTTDRRDDVTLHIMHLLLITLFKRLSSDSIQPLAVRTAVVLPGSEYSFYSDFAASLAECLSLWMCLNQMARINDYKVSFYKTTDTLKFKILHFCMLQCNISMSNVSLVTLCSVFITTCLGKHDVLADNCFGHPKHN